MQKVTIHVAKTQLLRSAVGRSSVDGDDVGCHLGTHLQKALRDALAEHANRSEHLDFILGHDASPPRGSALEEKSRGNIQDASEHKRRLPP